MSEQSFPSRYGDSIIWRTSDGRVHRIGGPAKIYDNGVQAYFEYDELHSIDGPALIIPYEKDYVFEHYYLHGTRYHNKEEWEIARDLLIVNEVSSS